MNIRLIASAALIFAASAQAGEVVIHVGSYHSPSTYAYQGETVSYNNVNPGVGYRFDNGVVVGAYYNSYREPTVYAGYAPLWQTPIQQLQLGGMIGVGTGYSIPTGRSVTPLGALIGRWELTDTYSVQLLFVPKIHGDMANVLHLAFGVKL